jgi:hypothetical protein
VADLPEQMPQDLDRVLVTHVSADTSSAFERVSELLVPDS